MILLALALQAAVGQPLPEVEVAVREARRVGQTLTVDYTVTNRTKTAQPMPLRPTVVRDPAGHDLPVGKPEDGDAPQSVRTQIEPGLTVGQSVSVDLGQNITQTVYGMNPQTYNESTWYFVVGQQQVPFSF